MQLEEQLAYFDRYAGQAWARSLRDMRRMKEVILSEARARLVTGYTEYGDRSWSKTYTELRQDELEELADAIVYRLMRMYQGGRHDRRVCSRPI